MCLMNKLYHLTMTINLYIKSKLININISKYSYNPPSLRMVPYYYKILHSETSHPQAFQFPTLSLTKVHSFLFSAQDSKYLTHLSSKAPEYTHLKFITLLLFT